MKPQSEPKKHHMNDPSELSHLLPKVDTIRDQMRRSLLNYDLALMKQVQVQCSFLLEEFEELQMDMVRRHWEQGMSHIPDEILREIFTLAVDKSNPGAGFAFYLVSRRWNRVAWDTPAIHRFINSSRPSFICSSLERTRNYNALEIDLNLRDYHFGDVQKTLEVLVPSCHRWQSLKIDTDQFDLMERALEYLSEPAPRLQTLDLRYSPYSEEEDIEEDIEEIPARPTVTAFQGVALSLRSLKLSGVHVPWSSSLLRGLESLSLDAHCEQVRPSYAEFKIISEGCPNLRYLLIAKSGPLNGLRTEILHFQQLEELVLDTTFEEASTFIRHFSTPSLLNLTVHAYHRSTILQTPPLVNLIGIKPLRAPHLKRLELLNHGYHTAMPPCEDILDMLRRFPHLTELQIGFLSKDVIAALSTQGTTGWICPELEELRTWGSDDMEPEDLVNLIEGRLEVTANDAPSAIREIYLSQCPKIKGSSGFIRWARENVPIFTIDDP